jgi:restriction endonuclease Mrr
MLSELGDPNVSPKVVALYRHGLISQFGLNQQELGILDAAAATMKSSLLTMQANVHAITASKATLGASDLAALANLDAVQNQVVASLASKILSSVRTESAARFRVAAQLVPNATKGVH